MAEILSKAQRSLLASTILLARERVESAARAAVEHLAVHEKTYRPHMSKEQQTLRNRLRARARALGDIRDERDGTQRIERLVEAVAYEQWHRLLFTRFLAENALLHTDEEHGVVPVTLAECEELASELGARDGFELACQFAARTLPGVFRRDDPILELRLATNDDVELRRLLQSLPAEVFRADDALGWTYQYWQAKRKDEVNKSEKKIGAEELPAVTQLFTEDYMVAFLLDNTLGAWWAGKRGPVKAASEEEARRGVALAARDGIPEIAWGYLRFVQDEDTRTWRPAAGTFEGWPKAAKEVRFLDPCMGSGHFVVFALPILARLRMEEERLSARAAVSAVLRDNLYGLELDERCTQIAAFNTALTAWKLGGWQTLPPMHLACSGLAPNAPEKDWVALAGKNDRLRQGMARLHALFKDAPVLGSLIDPRRASRADLVEAEFDQLEPLLTQALRAEKGRDEDDAELGVVAKGIAKAAEMLAAQFTLVATNVPYLGLRKQSPQLSQYISKSYPSGKEDLAIAFAQRIEAWVRHGSAAVVLPQNWFYQYRYRHYRQALLSKARLSMVGRIGEGGFQSGAAAGAFVALCVVTFKAPDEKFLVCSIDVSNVATPTDKASGLRAREVRAVHQRAQLENPDSRLSFEQRSTAPLLSAFVVTAQGVKTGDDELWVRCFWEVPEKGEGWRWYQTSTVRPMLYGGRSHIIDWRTAGKGMTRPRLDSPVVGKRGVVVSAMREIVPTLYSGDIHYSLATPLVPLDARNLGALWMFCSSPEYNAALRQIEQNIAVTTDTFAKVPFDLDYWQKAFAAAYPSGFPKPASTDPTQWLFSGNPRLADEPLQVAVARLLGFRWPPQTVASIADCATLGPDSVEQLADSDGIVCLAPLNKEQPAAARLRALLAAAFGREWSAGKERDLLAEIDSAKEKLEDWLRDEFFAQHCVVFHDRPFIWHIWDGRKDGFHALVNYHRLDNAALQKLAYSYLGDWIRQQDQDAKADKPGAAERLDAARTLQEELAKILKGEPPYDIFVRWKPLSKQSIGWHPDLNDGVRQNIRPFMKARDVGKRGAGILRSRPKSIKWDKDRGKEPKRAKDEYPWFWSEEPPPTDYKGGREFKGLRWNDVHYSLKEKRAAR